MTPAAAPKCPPDMPQDVRDEFARLHALMGTRAKDEDRNLLAMLAQSWVTWRKAQAQVAEFGITVMSGGCAISNPALSTAAQAHRQIVEISRELRITPSARKR